ncbi:MAG: DNA-3-methyladenine glycosylase family protein [Nostocoides sp.]
MTPLERTHRPVGTYAFSATINILRHGSGDPTFQVAQGWVWLGLSTPDGPATVALVADPSDAAVHARAWGDGAAWAVEHVPSLLGADDDPSGFEPRHESIAAAWRRFSGWRVTRSSLVLQSLVPACIEQRVTGREAFAAHRLLVRRHGAPAPGPGGDLGLFVPPAPRDWAKIPSWDWIRAGVDAGRSGAAVAASRHAARLEECSGLAPGDALRRLRAVPGVGEWTAAETSQRALGDADAVSFGDFHVAKDVGWALTGAAVDDDGLRDLLEPYAGHRYRVQALVALAGLHRPRRGPRRPPPTHLPRSGRHSLPR